MLRKLDTCNPFIKTTYWTVSWIYYKRRSKSRSKIYKYIRCFLSTYNRAWPKTCLWTRILLSEKSFTCFQGQRVKRTFILRHGKLANNNTIEFTSKLKNHRDLPWCRPNFPKSSLKPCCSCSPFFPRFWLRTDETALGAFKEVISLLSSQLRKIDKLLFSMDWRH